MYRVVAIVQGSVEGEGYPMWTEIWVEGIETREEALQRARSLEMAHQGYYTFRVEEEGGAR